MDGADAKAIVTYNYTHLTNCPCMAIDPVNLSISITFQEPSGVYGIDTYDLEGQRYRSTYLVTRKRVPSHMHMFEGDLIWVGRPSRSNGASTRANDVVCKARLQRNGIHFVYKEYNDYINRSLPHVTGLTYYDNSPKWANNSLREWPRESHLCEGVPLLSETGQFRCACPEGTRQTVDGLSCKSKCC